MGSDVPDDDADDPEAKRKQSEAFGIRQEICRHSQTIDISGE